METTIDDWHQQRLAVLALGALTPSFVRVAEAGDGASLIDRAEALAMLRSISQRNPDIRAVGIMDGRGNYLLDTDPTSTARRPAV